MPTYLYRCEAGHEFEVEQRITDEPLTLCSHEDPGCDGDEMCMQPCKRLIPRTSFTLKGKGWAKDGYGG